MKFATAHPDHMITVHLQPWGTWPYVFICTGYHQQGVPFRANREDFTYAKVPR